MYDFSAIREVLHKVGFDEIQRSSYRKSSIPDIEYLDLEFRRNESLYVEAIK